MPVMEGAQHVSGKWLPFRIEGSRNAVLAELGARQHGVVALGQLTVLGLTASAVRKRAATGQLHRVHRGVYAVGHRRLTREGLWMAAVLAYGPGAVLSHQSAGALWGISADAATKVHVSLPSRSVRMRRGIEAHAAACLSARDVTQRDGIPCTTVARTLLDLAGSATRRELERAVSEAEVQSLFDRRELEEASRRTNGVPAVMRDVLAEWAGPAITASELEERFLALCGGAGIATPEVNPWVLMEDGALKVDFLWRDARLVVETDGRAVHGTARAFERDRERDQRLASARYRVVRFTWRQVTEEPERVARTLRELLGR